MYRWIAGSMIVAGMFVADASAQGKRDVNKAIESQYPDAKTEKLRDRTINGVNVQEVRITTEQGESIARVTEHGDFLVSGSPARRKELPQTVVKTYQNLFGERPPAAEQFTVTNYVLNLTMDDKSYRAVVDATGRIREISRGEEVRWQKPKSMNAIEGDDRERVEKLAARHLDGGTVENVYSYPDAPNFYLVEAKTPGKGHSAQLIMNAQNEIASERTGVAPEDLPAPVRQTVDRLFKNSEIKDAFRLQYQYYQFEQPAQDGDQLVVKVRADGDVMDARSVANTQDEEAVTAAAKTKGSDDKRNDRDRGDRGN